MLGTEHPLGSNAYGVGSDGTRDGRSVVLGNPHFPWQGSERWYEMHLTIPGKLDAIGAGLQGVPVVNIGFNKHVAWSHTVSTARRFTPYELKLVAGDPTSYMVDGKAVKMKRRTVTVRTPSGVERHTFYETRWGPVFDYPVAGLTWDTETAYALADANADNFRLTNQWSEYDVAKSVGDLRRASAKVQGNPWVNVIAADSAGRAYYADDSVVPNVDAALQQRCVDLGEGAAAADRGRRPARRLQGVVPLGQRPRRGRQGHPRPEGAPARDPARLRGELQRLLLAAERALPPVRLPAHHRAGGDAAPVPHPARARAGRAAAGRHGRPRPGRLHAGHDEGRLQRQPQPHGRAGQGRGRAGLPRERGGRPGRGVRGAGRVGLPRGHRLARRGAVARGVDPPRRTGSRGRWRSTRPIRSTPRATSTPPTRRSSPRCAARSRSSGPRASRSTCRSGDKQAEPRGSERIAIPGCSEVEGCFNIISTRRDDQGNYDPYTGSSFVMVAGFDAKGRPSGSAILSYSQSENPLSPHFADQTKLFSQEKWLPMRFSESSIKADADYSRRVVSGRR